MSLDVLALTYLKTGKETDFNTLYSEFNKQYSSKYPKIAGYINNDMNSIQAAYEDTLLRTLSNFSMDKGDFTHYLRKSLKNTTISLMKKYHKRIEKEILVNPILSGDMEERNIFYKLSDGVDLQEEIVSYLEDCDFRKRVNESAIKNNLTSTLEIIELIYEGATVYKAASQVGICHKTAKRRLEKIFRKVV